MTAANAHTPENWRARCDWCGWNLDPEGEACRPFDCSMRPRPKLSDTDLRQECRKAEAQNAALLAALQAFVAEWDNTYDAEVGENGLWRSNQPMDVRVIEQARAALAQAQKGTP